MVKERNPELEAIITLNGSTTYETALDRLKPKRFLEAVGLDLEHHEYLDRWFNPEFVEEEPKKGWEESKIVPGFVQGLVTKYRNSVEERPVIDITALTKDVKAEEGKVKKVKERMGLIAELSRENTQFRDWLDLYYKNPTTKVDIRAVTNLLRLDDTAKEIFSAYYFAQSFDEESNAVTDTIDSFVGTMIDGDTTEKRRERVITANNFVAKHYMLISEVYLFLNQKIYSVLNNNSSFEMATDVELEEIYKAIDRLKILKEPTVDKQSYENLFDAYIETIKRHTKLALMPTKSGDSPNGDLLYTGDVAVAVIERLRNQSIEYLEGKNAFADNTSIVGKKSYVKSDVKSTGNDTLIKEFTQTPIGEGRIDLELDSALRGNALRSSVNANVPVATFVEDTRPLLGEETIEDAETLVGVIVEEPKKVQELAIQVPPPIKKNIRTRVTREDETYIGIITEQLGSFVAAAGDILEPYLNPENNGLKTEELAEKLKIYARTVEDVVATYENTITLYKEMLRIERDGRKEATEDALINANTIDVLLDRLNEANENIRDLKYSLAEIESNNVSEEDYVGVLHERDDLRKETAALKRHSAEVFKKLRKLATAFSYDKLRMKKLATDLNQSDKRYAKMSDELRQLKGEKMLEEKALSDNISDSIMTLLRTETKLVVNFTPDGGLFGLLFDQDPGSFYTPNMIPRFTYPDEGGIPTPRWDTGSSVKSEAEKRNQGIEVNYVPFLDGEEVIHRFIVSGYLFENSRAVDKGKGYRFKVDCNITPGDYLLPGEEGKEEIATRYRIDFESIKFTVGFREHGVFSMPAILGADTPYTKKIEEGKMKTGIAVWRTESINSKDLNDVAYLNGELYNTWNRSVLNRKKGQPRTNASSFSMRCIEYIH